MSNAIPPPPLPPLSDLVGCLSIQFCVMTSAPARRSISRLLPKEVRRKSARSGPALKRKRLKFSSRCNPDLSKACTPNLLREQVTIMTEARILDPHAKHFRTTCKHRGPGPFPSMQLTIVGLSVGEDGRGKGQGSCVKERAQVPRARGECSLGFRCTENASSNPSRARDQNSTQTSCVGKRTHC